MEKTLLRLITCGSVDDGKSTLLGRLLYETGSAFEDELAACGGDLSRLLDGLEAEREQGITIDAIVAEMRASRLSERQGRLIDRDGTASMERKKREGYF